MVHEQDNYSRNIYIYIVSIYILYLDPLAFGDPGKEALSTLQLSLASQSAAIYNFYKLLLASRGTAHSAGVPHMAKLIGCQSYSMEDQICNPQ